MSEKKLPLRNMDDCVEWFEKTANDVTQDPHAIAQANSRASCVKGVMGLQKLLLDYKRFVAQSGSAIHETQMFFATKPKQLEKKA